MLTSRFHKPVIVQPGRIDRDRVVFSVADAAEILLRQWPSQKSEARAEAMRACLAALRGEKSARTARRLFVHAAKEARIFLGEQI